MDSSSVDLCASAAVIMERLAITSRDRLSIICTTEPAAMRELADAVADCGRSYRATVETHEYASGRDGQEPPSGVASAMREATALVLLTKGSLSHTRARVEATKLGVRIASMPGIDRDTFVRALPTDYEHLRRYGQALAARLTEASSCHVSSPGGTDIALSLVARTALLDDGDLRQPGAFGNLPAGEAYIAPRESEANGRIVFDGSLSGWGLLKEPVAVVLKGGRVVGFEGGAAAQWLRETLDAGGENGRVIAELGIGANPGALVRGVVLEDEKAKETVHFAFGTNKFMGGENEAAVHIDALVLRPNVELDGVDFLDHGRLVTPRGCKNSIVMLR